MEKLGNTLAMLKILETGRKFTVNELAEKIEVSPRMIKTYKAELEQAGIYIDTINGIYGGYVYSHKNNYDVQFSIKDVNCIEKIKQLNKKQNVCVLSKVNSEEEEKAKREYLLENGINAMCFVPYISSKTQFVEVKGNILIDDDLKNLNDWQNRGGIPIFFNENLDNYDSYGKKNDKYLITNDLLKIYDLIKIYDII